MGIKDKIKCGVTGCPNEVIGECDYCGIPLCEDHAQKLETNKSTELYCAGCFLYVSVSGLKERDLDRRLIPNVLFVNSRKCTGCRTCELVCSFEHFGVFSYDKSAVELKKDEEYGKTEIVLCRHCDDPKCVEICPTDALKKDKNTGLVSLNREKCIQCMRCVEECPYDAIFSSKDKKIIKCDLCGGDPMCAKYCPAEAIEWVKKHKIGERKKLTYFIYPEEEER